METIDAAGAKITWIFVFIILYWGYCVFWGIRGGAQAHHADDYFLAGRQLPSWVFVLAVTAVIYSGWTFLGDPGAIYTGGLSYSYAEVLGAITMPLTGVLFLKRQWMIGRRFGFVTPGEMLAYYFQSNLIRLLVVIVALVFTVPYVGLQLRAAGFLFNVLTDGLVGVEFGMWVLSVVVISYVATGGLRTAAYAATLQAVLMLVGIVIIGTITLFFVGGWDRLLAGIAALSQEDTLRTPAGYSHYVAIPGVIQFVSGESEVIGGTWTGTMILTYSLALMGIMSAPAFSMWAFASRSPAAFAPQQVWASAFVMGLVTLLFTTLQGFGGHMLGADHVFMISHFDLVNPVMVEGLRSMDIMMTPGKQDMLGPVLIELTSDIVPWLTGLLAVCALAAMESTASCYMATAGAIFTRDVLKRFLIPNADDRTQKFAGRLSVVAVVLLALIVASTSQDALVILGGLAVSYGFQMWPALIGVCFWPFLTRQGVTLGLIAGLIAVTLTESIGQQWLGITAWGRWPLTIHSAGWGILCNLTVAILVSSVTGDDQERKMEFHGLLRKHAALPPHRRRLAPLAWTVTLLWLIFALGPGVVIGNTLFGDPNAPETWLFGIPSLWIWQFLSWIFGVALIGFLAYYMKMSTAPDTEIEPSAQAEKTRLPTHAETV